MFLPRIELIRKIGVASYEVILKGYFGEFVITMNTQCEWHIRPDTI